MINLKLACCFLNKLGGTGLSTCMVILISRYRLVSEFEQIYEHAFKFYFDQKLVRQGELVRRIVFGQYMFHIHLSAVPGISSSLFTGSLVSIYIIRDAYSESYSSNRRWINITRSLLAAANWIYTDDKSRYFRPTPVRISCVLCCLT